MMEENQPEVFLQNQPEVFLQKQPEVFFQKQPQKQPEAFRLRRPMEVVTLPSHRANGPPWAEHQPEVMT
jgi:hypothetical protein